MENINKYILAAVVLFSIYLIYLLVKPFLVSIMVSFILAYVFYPLYKKINSKIRSSNLSAFAIIIILLLLIIVPSAFVISSLIGEINTLYNTSMQTIFSEDVISGCTEGSLLCRSIGFISSLSADANFMYYFDLFLSGARQVAFSTSSEFLLSLPNKVLNTFVVFFITFYLLQEGDKLVFMIKQNLLPGRYTQKDRMLKRIKEVTNAVIYGNLLTALIQGIVASIGFFIFGVKSPLLLGLFTVFGALIPYIGTAIVWLPVSLYVLLTAILTEAQHDIFRGAAILLYGVFIISSVDNIVRPLLIGDRGQMHPVIVLLGVFGGLTLFGFLGIFLGPILLTLLITFIQIYGSEFGYGTKS